MDLPSTFAFQGWNIRYKISTSNKDSLASLKPIVFVHGTPWSSIVYKPTIETLLAKGSYQILTYDLPGYGQSQTYEPSSTSNKPPTDQPTKPYFQGDTSVKFQASALTALLAHTKLDGQNSNPKPAIIAHDIAGTIVLRTHLIHSIDFYSMMLIDTNTVLPWGDGFYKLVRSNPQPFLHLPPKIFEAVVRAVTQSACFNPEVLKSKWEELLVNPWIDKPMVDVSSSSSQGDDTPNLGRRSKQHNFIQQIAQSNDQDIADMITINGNMYEQVRCDVKIIWGEQDQWIPKEKIEDLIRRLGSKVKESVFIPDAGHLVMLDQPGRFVVEVLDWVRR